MAIDDIDHRGIGARREQLSVALRRRCATGSPPRSAGAISGFSLRTSGSSRNFCSSELSSPTCARAVLPRHRIGGSARLPLQPSGCLPRRAAGSWRSSHTQGADAGSEAARIHSFVRLIAHSMKIRADFHTHFRDPARANSIIIYVIQMHTPK